MFENLKALPPDAILGLSTAYKADDNPSKVDLGAGVYKTDSGHTPILSCVAKAARLHAEREDSKTYLSPLGNPGFNKHILELVLGADHSVLRDQRAHAIQAPGGSGALSVDAGFIKRANPEATIWVSTPTWANHIPLLGSSGLNIKEYPYYNYQSHSIDFDAMMACLKQVTKGDLVLLHGCCHNPCGADLDHDQWRAIADLAVANGFTPFVDFAYQGFGEGPEEDAFGVRLLADMVPEMIVASSCSKNFGLYRERTGAAILVAASKSEADICHSQMSSVVRSNYSMPPNYGAALVDIVLSEPELTTEWRGEVAEMRERIARLRGQLVEGLANAGVNTDFSFIARENGMFSFLGVTPDQVKRLVSEYSIYMVGSSRISVAGLNPGNLDYVCASIAEVLRS
jgi:aspartate aminotransferase